MSSPKKRYRNFVVLLYVETESYDFEDVVDRILHRFKYVSYIQHDYDINDDGTPKKSHVHFVCQQDNGSTVDAIAKVLGVPSNFIEPCSSVKSQTRYLIHIDDPEKYQYDKLDVKTNDPKFLDYFPNFKPTEAEACTQLIDYICKNQATLREVCDYAYKNDIWAYFRKNFFIIRHFIPGLYPSNR